MFNKITWIILFAGTLAMVYVMRETGKTLKTGTTPKGILDLEFAHNSEKVEAVLNAWSVKGDTGSAIDDAKRNTYFDFIFLLFYSSFLYCSCILLGRSGSIPTIKKLSVFFAIAALLAGLLDIMENIGMLQSLDGKVSDSIAIFTTFCAGIKWTLVILVILFLLTGLIAIVSRKLRTTR